MPFRFLLLCLAASALFAAPARAANIESAAEQAILLDFQTGKVLYQKNADQPMPPASMSKLMTIFMLFERLADGRMKMEDEFEVSEKAWRMGGSKMFVEVGKMAKVEDLVRGIVVQSGNDACIVIAEAISGTEDAFAEAMSARAGDIGLNNSHFTNASGWPDDNHYMSAADLGLLAMRIIRDFPQYYPYFAERSFTYNKIRQGNRNPLLYKKIGADGLKTGHTRASGYGLVGSALRDGRRLIVVINGLTSVNQRSREAERMLLWGFREFGTYALFKAGETVSEAEVWLGDEATVPLVLKEPLTITLRRVERKQMAVKVRYRGPIAAPIAAGQELASLVISVPNGEDIERTLYAGATVEQLGMFGRLTAALNHLLWGVAGGS